MSVAGAGGAVPLGEAFADIFGRELDRLVAEVEAYENEGDLWVTVGAQKNPPGTLALHVVGNLMHFIGAGLGDTGFVRDREAEFTARPSRAELLARIRDCRATVTTVLGGLDDAAVRAPYPGEPPGSTPGADTHTLLLHLMWHLGWHLGHVYYHRLALVGWPED